MTIDGTGDGTGDGRADGVVVRERRSGVGRIGGLRALTVGTAGVEDRFCVGDFEWVPGPDTLEVFFATDVGERS